MNNTDIRPPKTRRPALQSASPAMSRMFGQIVVDIELKLILLHKELMVIGLA
ncbi:MAG: hypothetical protein AAF668_10770 [Pseudomonadota bacterium]